MKYGVGYDDVDIERFGKLGIPVCNVPDYGTREVADHAIALMMTLAKSIAYHDSELRADLKANWRPAHNPFGRRLSVCTYGVVGMGRIGTAAARRAKAFDMDVVFYDPYQPNGYQFAIGVRRADSLAELMGQCDFVSIHTPLTAETRNMIGADAFAAAKRGHDPDQHRARSGRRHRRAVRRDEGRHRARRRARRAAGGAGQSAAAADRRVAAQRGLDPPSPAADAALGLLHTGEHARQSRLRCAHGGALTCATGGWRIASTSSSWLRATEERRCHVLPTLGFAAIRFHFVWSCAKIFCCEQALDGLGQTLKVLFEWRRKSAKPVRSADEVFKGTGWHDIFDRERNDGNAPVDGTLVSALPHRTKSPRPPPSHSGMRGGNGPTVRTT